MPERLSPDDLDEFCLYWWGSDTDERTITDAIEDGSMSTFAKAVLTWLSE
jgi:hypothetical protein